MRKYWIIFMNSRFRIAEFYPLCLLQKYPNVNCNCVKNCKGISPKFTLTYNNTKYLPKHSLFSEDNKKDFRK